MWIGSTSWSIHTQITSIPDIQKVGTIIGFTDRTQTLDLLIDYTWELFTKLSEDRSPPPDPLNPCPQCWNFSPDNITLVEKPALQRTAFSVYAAIYSVAQALHKLLGCSATACERGPDTKIYPWKVMFGLFYR